MNFKSNKTKKLVKNNLEYLLFVSIPLTIFIIFFIIPNIRSFLLSVYRWDGLNEMKFVGIKNYVNLFSAGGKFLQAFKNTLIYTITVTIGQNIFGLLLAIFIYRNTRINKLLRTVYFMPAIFSTVAVGFIWGFIYAPNLGIINTFLSNIGLASLAQSWLGEPNLAMFSIAFVHIWKGVGISMILFITGLKQIPNELYESASIAGANRFQLFRYITLPQLRTTIMILIVLTTIGSFKAFDYVYILAGGGAGGQSEVLATLIYKEGFAYSRLGYSSAIAVVLLLIVSAISFSQILIMQEKK